MVFQGYLAMTGAEFRQTDPLPAHPAWMACHFSPYANGLSNFPEALPQGSMLILNDRTPIHGHDPAVILEQLTEAVERLSPDGVLLDLQRPGEAGTSEIAALLAEGLPCPVGVSACYGSDLDCPLFLPPVPLHMPVQEYLSPWSGREIWLEAALEGEAVTLTPEGVRFSPLSEPAGAEEFREEGLFCHYRIQTADDAVTFLLHRTPQDLTDLLAACGGMGVARTVGLYQELWPYCRPADSAGGTS